MRMNQKTNLYTNPQTKTLLKVVHASCLSNESPSPPRDHHRPFTKSPIISPTSKVAFGTNPTHHAEVVGWVPECSTLHARDRPRVWQLHAKAPATPQTFLHDVKQFLRNTAPL